MSEVVDIDTDLGPVRKGASVSLGCVEALLSYASLLLRHVNREGLREARRILRQCEISVADELLRQNRGRLPMEEWYMHRAYAFINGIRVTSQGATEAKADALFERLAPLATGGGIERLVPGIGWVVFEGQENGEVQVPRPEEGWKGARERYVEPLAKAEGKG